MKHLIPKEHHAHLRRRMIVEMFGLFLLIFVSYNQRAVFADSLHIITHSHWGYVVIGCVLYWSLLPITPISYRILAHRELSIAKTLLSQMAAAGPGRIIPGGLGHVAIGAEHLRKSGIPKQRALLVPLLNNLIGLVVTVISIALVLAVHRSWFDPLTRPINQSHITSLLVITLGCSGLILFGWHVRTFRRFLKPIKNQTRAVIRHMRNHPLRIAIVCLLAVLILAGHAAILMLAAKALDVGLDLQLALICLSSGILIGSLTPTPGGLGGVEAGIVSSMILFGFSAEQATSTALLFRLATYWQPLLPGVFAYAYLRRRSLL